MLEVKTLVNSAVKTIIGLLRWNAQGKFNAKLILNKDNTLIQFHEGITKYFLPIIKKS